MREACTEDCAPSKEMGEIDGEISELRLCIEKMVSLSDSIRGKVSVVCRSEPPQGPSVEQKPSPNTCTPLGGELRTLKNQVSNIIDTQEDILNRLEL